MDRYHARGGSNYYVGALHSITDEYLHSHGTMTPSRDSIPVVPLRRHADTEYGSLSVLLDGASGPLRSTGALVYLRHKLDERHATFCQHKTWFVTGLRNFVSNSLSDLQRLALYVYVLWNSQYRKGR